MHIFLSRSSQDIYSCRFILIVSYTDTVIGDSTDTDTDTLGQGPRTQLSQSTQWQLYTSLEPVSDRDTGLSKKCLVLYHNQI